MVTIFASLKVVVFVWVVSHQRSLRFVDIFVDTLWNWLEAIMFPCLTGRPAPSLLRASLCIHVDPRTKETGIVGRQEERTRRA
jgi:hypothetical protein